MRLVDAAEFQTSHVLSRHVSVVEMEEMHHEHDERNDEDNVDEATGNAKHQAQKPDDEEDDGDGGEHVHVESGAALAAVLLTFSLSQNGPEVSR